MHAVGGSSDIKGFHDAIPLRGPMPAAMLEWVVDESICEQETLNSDTRSGPQRRDLTAFGGGNRCTIGTLGG